MSVIVSADACVGVLGEGITRSASREKTRRKRGGNLSRPAILAGPRARATRQQSSRRHSCKAMPRPWCVRLFGRRRTTTRIVLDRIAPARRDNPVFFDLPKIERPADAVAATLHGAQGRSSSGVPQNHAAAGYGRRAEKGITTAPPLRRQRGQHDNSATGNLPAGRSQRGRVPQLMCGPPSRPCLKPRRGPLT